MALFLVHKPRGWTSHDVVAVCRKRLQTKQIGHTGTLDPLAEGLLVVMEGFSTKLLPFLVSQTKVYRVTGRLFCSSDSYDIETPMTELEHKEISYQRFLEVCESFLGKSMQKPPLYSAKKIQGQKACNIARRGGSIELPACPVEIFFLKIHSFDGRDFDIEMKVSSGTYIRSFVHDIWVALGTDAVMTSLLRTAVEDFILADAHAPGELLPEHGRAEHTLGLVTYQTTSEEQARLIHGGGFPCCPDRLSGEVQSEETVVLLLDGTECLGLCHVRDNHCFPFRVKNRCVS